MSRFLWWGPLVALFAIAGYVSAGESTDVKELLERMKKMESKMADQEKTIKDLRAGGEVKASASQQVDKALSNSAASAIFHDPTLHKRPIRIGGYLDVSYQYAFNQPTTPMPQYNMERVFDDMDNNDFNVHMAKIFFDATAKEKGQAGFRIDLAFGSDADRISSFGELSLPNIVNTLTPSIGASPIGTLGTDINSWIPNLGNDNFTLQQAYIDYIIPVANGIRMKVGKFASPIGFEVLEAQDNWNATRSFNYGHGMPKTITGIGFEYQVYSNWNVAGYLVNGWDNMIDNNEGKSVLLQSKWSPTKWLNWTVSGMVGNEAYSAILPDVALGGTSINLNQDRSGEDTTYLINTVLTFKPWEKWEFALEGNWGLTENGSNNDANDGSIDGGFGWLFSNYNGDAYASTPDAEWWGVAGYLKYKFLPSWYLASRGEYFNDSGATRTVYGKRFGGKQELYSGTVTMAYAPTSPFEIRLEYRYDASSRDNFISKEFNLVNPHPADLNSRSRVNSQDTLTVQFLYKF